MNSILNIGRTGMNAVQRKMDSISDDIANLNTYGYKRKDISFKELLTNNIHENDVLLSDGANNKNINMGTMSDVARLNFEQGIIVSSPRELDMAIEGRGFFGVLDGDGTLSLTRNGSFHLNSDGSITNDAGYYLSMVRDTDLDGIDLDALNLGDEDLENLSFESISITPEGSFIGHIGDVSIPFGKVMLYNTEVLDSLVPLGDGRYLPSENVALIDSAENTEGFGSIRQYSLESSNTDLAKSLVDMITSQRSYSLSLKAVQTTDEIMQMTNNIK